MKLSSSILIIVGYLVAVDGRCRKYRYTTQERYPQSELTQEWYPQSELTQEWKSQPKLSYNTYKYNSNEIFGRNAASNQAYDTASLKQKHHPSLSCLLFGDDGCQLSCNLMCNIHGCQSDGFCQNRSYCHCNELYLIQNQALTANQFQRLSFEQLWNYKFAASSSSSKIRNRILQANELHQFVLPLLQNPHKSGHDVKNALLARYPELRNVQNLKPQDHGAIANPLDDDFNLQQYVQDMIKKMQKQVYDRIHHVRYMRRIINLIKKINDEDDLLYILTQLSLMGNERLYERVRRYLIKQGHYFDRDLATGQIRKKSRCKKHKKRKVKKCKCKPKRFLQSYDVQYDDLYDETDEAVEMALVNELINTNDTNGQFPIFKIPPPEANGLEQQADTDYLIDDIQQQPVPQVQPYPANDVQNDSTQQQSVAYSQVNAANHVQEAIQPINRLDRVDYPSNFVQQEIVPSGYETEEFFNSQSSHSEDTGPQTFIVEQVPQPINILTDYVSEPVPVQQSSPLVVNQNPFVPTELQQVNTLSDTISESVLIQPSPLTVPPSPSINTITPVDLEVYDISDVPVEPMFLKHQSHNEAQSYAESLLTSNTVPTHTTTHTQTTTTTASGVKRPESYAYYLLDGNGDLATSSSTTQSQSETIISAPSTPSPSQVQKSKDKIYYQLLMDEDGNIIKTANYKYPGQIQYTPSSPTAIIPASTRYTSTSTNQIDQSLLDKFNKQDLLNVVKSKTDDSILIDYDMESSHTLPAFDDIDAIHQQQTYAENVAVMMNELPSANVAPSTKRLGNHDDILNNNVADYNSQTITVDDWKPIPIDTPSIYHIDSSNNKAVNHSVNIKQDYNTVDIQSSQKTPYYNIDDSYDTFKNTATDHSFNIDQDYKNFDIQNRPILSNYETANIYNSPDDLTIDYVSNEVPIYHNTKPMNIVYSNNEGLYLENDVSNSQIKSNDDLTIDYEIDDYDYNSNIKIENTQSNVANNVFNTYDMDYGAHTINIESGEHFAGDHSVDNVHVHGADNVVDRYHAGSAISHSQITNGEKIIPIISDDHHESTEYDIPIECDDLVDPEDDLLNF